MMPSRLSTHMQVAAVAALFAAAPGAASAQKIEPAAIAVVDVQFLLRESSAGKDVRRQIEEIRTRYQAEIDKRQQTLRTEEDELRRQQTILSPEAFQQRRQKFQRRIATEQKYVQDTTKLVDESVGRAMGAIQQKVFEILDEIRGEFGYNLVLPKTQIVYGLKSLELTDEVLKRLDKRLPKMAVDLSPQQE